MHLAGIAPAGAKFHVAVGDGGDAGESDDGVAVRGQPRAGEVADVLLRLGRGDDLWGRRWSILD